jgi:hypothetical protein
MFHIDPVPTHGHQSSIQMIRPDFHLKKLGVDFTRATPAGLVAAYQHGQAKGIEFVSKREYGKRNTI